MNLNIETTKTYMDIQNGKKIVILRGGTRSAKSYSAIQWLIVRAIQEGGITVSVVRKSFPSLRISALRDFKTIMNSLGIWEEDRWMATEKAYQFDNGSLFEFLSVDDAEKRKGTKRDYLFIDEANELEYADFFQLFIRTTHKTILAFNPSFSKQNWIYTQVAIHPEAEEFISTYRDNPFLDESIVQEIERLKDISPSYYATYGNAEFGMIEGLIFDNIRVVDKLPEEAELLCYGLDAGYSNDPTALVGIFKWNDSIVIEEVVYLKGLLANQIAKYCLSAYDVYGKSDIWIDSSEPRLRDELVRYGLNCKSVTKGPNSIQMGIDLMKQNEILVTKPSSNLINEFFSYSWKKDSSGNLLNEPEDLNNHAIDAARYAVMMRMSKKQQNKGIYNINVGGYRL